MKKLCIKVLLLSSFLLGGFTIEANAQTFVYTDNDTTANSVTAFSVASNGTLTNIGTFATGGSGGGGGFFASNRARTCFVGNRLYVANDGSNNVSGFDINPTTGALTLVPGSPFATGGFSGAGISLDCTPNGQFLIAANAGSANITVFSIAGDGALTPVAGSPFAAGDLPDGIKVAQNGQFLSVALPDTDTVAMFSIASNGALTPVPGSPFASPATGVATGVDINCASTFLFAAHASFSGTNVDVFSIAPNGALTLVQTSNNPTIGSNSNVGVLSPNDQFLFVSNQFSNSVTVFNVAANGTISLVAGSPFGGTGGEPSGMATNAAGTFLFTADFVNSTVTSFSIASNGSLTLVGNFATGQPSGLLSLAVFPGKSCSGCGLNDTQAPSITCPANITAVAPASCPLSSTQVVNFTTTASDNCPGVVVACSPPSGAPFPLGTTIVTCTATDSSGNSATCSFTVTVFSGCLQDDSNPSTVVLFNAATGAYRFCCGGTIFTGTGAVTVRGCLVSITHNAADRRVQITTDGSSGGASLQSPPGNVRCTIQDRDVRNNSCVCQ